MSRDVQLRIGDAERDAVMLALREHFALGRLDRDELEQRLEATLTAKTTGNLRKITEDLPSLGSRIQQDALAEPRRQPERYGPTGRWPRHHYGLLRPLIPLLSPSSSRSSPA